MCWILIGPFSSCLCMYFTIKGTLEHMLNSLFKGVDMGPGESVFTFS